MRLFCIEWLLLSLCACTIEASQQGHQPTVPHKAIEWCAPIDPNGRRVETRFPAPDGYERLPLDAQSFPYYLRRRWLKAHGSPVRRHDGQIKQAQVHAAVIDLDTGKRDLQQCADAIMRLRAEYFYERKEFDSIAFNFTNGFRCAYRPWINGNRIQFHENKTWWVHRADTLESYLNFRKYLNIVFAFAGTWSLSQELVSIPYEEMKIGDIFIHGGLPGHAVIVIDMVVNPDTGKRLYLLAQSYMPAQEIHILKNPRSATLSPWYELDPDADELITPEWIFQLDELHRFPGEHELLHPNPD